MSVPMAFADPAPLWPLPLDSPKRLRESAKFGPPTARIDRQTGRKKWHAAIDLASKPGHPVIAPESGTVRLQTFLGPNAHAILLKTDTTGVVLLLGELDPATFTVQTGDRVEKGEHLGNVSWTGMVHFGAFAPGTRKTTKWFVGDPPPPEMMDPSDYVARMAAAAGEPMPAPRPEPAPAPAPAPAPWPGPTPAPSSSGDGLGMVILLAGAVVLIDGWATSERRRAAK